MLGQLETHAETPATPAEVDLTDPALYLNRELSWLEFNQRVLEEAHDQRNLLLDRLKFLAITASNLDEFYGKRVGWLRRSLRSDGRGTTVDGLTFGEQLHLVLQRCFAMSREMDDCWRDELQPQLAERGICVVPFASLDQLAREALSTYF